MDIDSFKTLVRRLESIEKTLNQIYKDRDIMEDSHVRIGTLTDEVKVLQDRVAKLEKHTVAQIKGVSDKVDGVQDSIEGM